MINDKENTKISKFLSLVLRHQPETIGISLDENGWTDVNTLIDKMNHNGFTISNEILKYIVESNNKKRFAFNEANTLIRASQGHSIEVNLGYSPQQPPLILFHGTSDQNVESILNKGIEKRSRNHVHLSLDIDTAIKVGQRHGKPVIFEVASGQMYEDGFKFFISENNVWLTDQVPSKYLKLAH
jgi:putative RNA 2'-phosphotransferase